MKSKRIGASLLALVLLRANSPVDPAIAFGARENVEFIALSPDGTRVAYAVPTWGRARG